MDNFRYEKDTIIVDDRGYFDFKLFRQRIDDENIFVGLFKSNTTYEVIEELELQNKMLGEKIEELQNIINEQVKVIMDTLRDLKIHLPGP